MVLKPNLFPFLYLLILISSNFEYGRLTSSYTKSRLRNSWYLKTHQERSPVIEDQLNQNIKDLKAEIAEIATVRKDRVFDSEVTEEEEVLIQKRVKLQQLLVSSTH